MSPDALWSWGLTAIGLTGFWITGSGRIVGWCVNIAAQGLWLAYAIQTEQPGFVVSALAYGGIFTRNWLAARRRAKTGSL